MNLSHFLSSSASDEMLLRSVADYFEGKVDSSIELVSELADIVENIGVDGYQPPDLSNFAMSYNDGSHLVGIDANEVRDALLNERDSITVQIEGVNRDVLVDDIINQLSDSLQTNQVMTESIYALISSGSDSASAVLSDFSNRIQLKMGVVSDVTHSMASSFINVLTATGVSVGDRVRNLLQFIGMYSFDTQEGAPVPIGLPRTDLSDITGSNVFQAFFTSFPDRLSKVGEWIIDTVKKTIQVMEGILQTFLGSSGYRMIKKFLGTLTLQADSFAYNTGEENGLSIGSHGFSCVLTGFNYNNSPWLQGLDLSTMKGKAIAILRAMGQTPTNDLSILELLTRINDSINNPVDGTPYYHLYHAIKAKGPFRPPFWLFPVMNGTPENTIVAKTVNSFIFFNDYIRSFARKFPGVDSLLQSMLGALLDSNHVNDDDGFMNKLQSTNYLSIDLPCSTLYFWLVGADICMTRRVSPCALFMDDEWSGVERDVLVALSNYKTKDYVMDTSVTITGDSMGAFFASLRTSVEKYVNNDEQMAKAVFAANVVDAVYLDLINLGYTSNVSMEGDVPSREIFLRDAIPAGGPTDLCFKLITGRSISDFRNKFMYLDNNAISNYTLCDILGTTLGTVTFNNPNVNGPLLALLHYTAKDEYYVPYVHVTSIPAGRYRVITDKELSNVVVQLLEVSAAIASALLVVKVSGKLKRKALAARTKADSVAWDQVTKGKYDDEAVKLQYKLQKQAQRMDALASAMFNGVGRVIGSMATTVQSMVTASTAKLRSTVSGLNNGVETDLSLYDIMRILRGY